MLDTLKKYKQAKDKNEAKVREAFMEEIDYDNDPTRLDHKEKKRVLMKSNSITIYLTTL